jgi:hypothetical protein
MQTLLRVGLGIATSEDAAAHQVWRKWRWRLGHPAPAPLVSDGHVSHADTLLNVFGQRHPKTGRRLPGSEWHYIQAVNIHNDYHHVVGRHLRVVWGRHHQQTHPLPVHVAYVVRTHLTSRLMNARLARRTLRFSKRLRYLWLSWMWNDVVYNLIRPHASLRRRLHQPPRRWQPCSPAMAAGLTDHLWTFQELLLSIPIFFNSL